MTPAMRKFGFLTSMLNLANTTCLAEEGNPARPADNLAPLDAEFWSKFEDATDHLYSSDDASIDDQVTGPSSSDEASSDDQVTGPSSSDEASAERAKSSPEDGVLRITIVTPLSAKGIGTITASLEAPLLNEAFLEGVQAALKMFGVDVKAPGFSSDEEAEEAEDKCTAKDDDCPYCRD